MENVRRLQTQRKETKPVPFGTMLKLIVLSTIVFSLMMYAHMARAASHAEAFSNNRSNDRMLKNDIDKNSLYHQYFQQSLASYKNGRVESATNLLNMLARLDHAPAQYFLGTMYMFGKGVKQNETFAVYWYTKAANSGHLKAQYNLGIAYANGIGVLTDMNQAIDWWQQAASGGNSDAQYNLGLIYSQGVGVKRNANEGAQWYRMAAIKGDAAAQYNLGVMYAKGDGVQKSIVEALKWWQRSANQGFKQAKNVLKLLETGTK